MPIMRREYMKKYILLSIIVAIFVGLAGYYSKFYYPSLPFDGVSKHVVVKALEKSNGELIQITNDKDYDWYGIESNQEVGRAQVIEMMEAKGLKYEEYMGSGIIFTNGNDKVIVTSQMWTRKYVVYKIPEFVMDDLVTKPSVQPNLDFQPEFSTELVELSINQRSAMDSWGITNLDEYGLPKKPVAYALHMDEVYIFLKFRTRNKEEDIHNMLEQIQFDGGVDYTIEEENPGSNRYKLDITNIDQSFSFTLGDLSAITIERKAPLQFKVAKEPLSESIVMMINAKEYGTRIYVSDQESSVVIEYPEPMTKMVSENPQENGGRREWIDSRHFKVELDSRPYLDTHFYFNELISESGNYPERGNLSFVVIQKSDQQWMDYATGERLGWSDWDRFYDNIIFSPNQKSYIGIVPLGGAMGDGDGYSYAFVLEQKGREPIIIEDVFYSTITNLGEPVQWISNNKFLFATYMGIYIYNIDTQERQTVYNMEEGWGNVNYTIYDIYRDRLYALILQEVKRENDYNLNQLIYHDITEQPITKENYTQGILANSYSLEDMVINPVKSGVYWTQLIDGKVMTLFESDDGSVVSASGKVIARLSTGVVLRVMQYNNSDGNFEGYRYYYWEPGEKPQILSEPPGQVRPFGTEVLISYTDSESQFLEEREYYKYNLLNDEWDPMKIQGKNIWLPHQAENPYYRILKP